MTEDKLPKELAKVAREEEAEQRRRFDERWDALSAGELSDQERRELHAAARESSQGTDAWEAFRPLGDEYRRQLAEKLTASLQEESTAEILPFGRRRRWVRWAVPAAALAASLLLVLLPLGEVAPLPTYEVALEGAVSGERSVGAGREAEALVFVPGNRFDLILRPETNVEGPVSVEIWRAGNEEVRRLPMPAPQIAPSGTVRVRGSVGGDVSLPTGSSTLIVVVGREGELPDGPAAWRSVGPEWQAAGDGWQAWRLEIRVE